MNARMAVKRLPTPDILYDLLNILTKTKGTGVTLCIYKKRCNAENYLKKKTWKKCQRNENQPKSNPKNSSRNARK